ncbi:MAG: 2-dehydropantoate 2-reductase N-terminal domain-containing protein [Xenococcaceae cyanobacterium MO_207.B15]|nr:2-dehydropantoate 2-reductase N-terminal domain-containing protein [Xenococcaceae cyanobacterium MO_207.B15]MDJ0744263.1 2-dehydropantoate 2-reductase N-terminal domain-containing protein [Xenococcaceae cyanobacterium MO_167.B27]
MNNILVIGAGSVGTLMGASLIKAGLRVTFAGRPRSSYTKQIEGRGLTISYSTGERFCISPLQSQVCFIDTETYLAEKFDLIIVALKSNDLAKVASYIKDHSTQDTLIIHAQNGIPYWWFDDEFYLASLNKSLLENLGSRRYLDSVDSEGKILRTLGDRILVGCVVKAPCHKTPEGYIQVKKSPKLIIGLTKSKANSEQQTIVKQLCQIFSEHGVSATYTTEIRTEVCNKLAINATTNVLSALTGRVIADLTANTYTNQLIKTILGEINQVFQLYGIKSQDLPSETKIYSYIQEPGSQSHLPSLAQDFSNHRAGEISLITAPVEMAKIANFAVPTLSSLGVLLELGQIYTLKAANGKSHILTFDNSSGYCILTQELCQSSVFDKVQIPHVFNHLMQVNLSAIKY